MKKLITSTIIVSLILAACTNKNTPTPKVTEKNKPIETMKLDDFFIYEKDTKYSYQGEGNEFASYTVIVDYFTQNKAQTRTDNGGTEFINVIEKTQDEIAITYFRGETYFRENFIGKDINTSNKRVLLKEPLKEGTSWQSGDDLTSTITSVLKEITTPSGKYNAVEVTTKGKNYTNTDYYAKGIGLVKTISKGEGYEVSSTLSNIEKNVSFKQNIKIFYPDVNGGKLKTLEVPISFKTNEEPKLIIERELKNLSVYKLISTNTKINQINFNENENSVHIDLSKDFIKEMNAGAWYEGQILESIASSLGMYYGVNKVYLSIDGGNYESGHIIIEKGEPLNVDLNNLNGS